MASDTSPHASRPAGPEATRAAGPATNRGRRRPAVEPARKRLALASSMVLLGSFLPWIDTALGSISGVRGAGLWTFYAAMLGLAGAMIPLRRLSAAQAALLALVAVGLTVWQVVHLLSLVGTGGWFPGPGLVLVFGGGVLAGHAAWQLARPVPSS